MSMLLELTALMEILMASISRDQGFAKKISIIHLLLGISLSVGTGFTIIGAYMIRIGLRGPLYYSYNKEPPK